MLVFGLCLLCECPSALKRNEKINWSPQAFWSGQLHTDQFCIFCFLGICQRYPHTHTRYIYTHTHTNAQAQSHLTVLSCINIYLSTWASAPFLKVKISLIFFFLFVYYISAPSGKAQSVNRRIGPKMNFQPSSCRFKNAAHASRNVFNLIDLRWDVFVFVRW